MPGLNPLVDKIRAAHPGAYDDLDDAALTKAVLNKYPQYSDLAAPPAAGGPSSVNMQQAPISPQERAMLPDEKLTSLSQQGEGYASDEGTSGAMSAAGAGTAAALGVGAGIEAALPRVIPATISGAKAIGAWASAHPVQAYIVYKTLLDHSAIAKFIKGAPTGAPGE